MNMTDLCAKESWAELEQSIHERFQLNGRAYDNAGFTFTGHVTWCNPVCKAIKASPEGAGAICSVAHQAMARLAAAKGEIVVSECDAGLIKICCPVVINDELVGVFGGCGRLPAGEEADAFLIAKATGIPQEEVERLASELTFMRPEEIEEVKAFLAQRRQELLAKASA